MTPLVDAIDDTLLGSTGGGCRDAPDKEKLLRSTCVWGICREDPVEASSSPTSWVMPAYSMSCDMAAVERLDTEEVSPEGGGAVPRDVGTSSGASSGA